MDLRSARTRPPFAGGAEVLIAVWPGLVLCEDGTRWYKRSVRGGRKGFRSPHSLTAVVVLTASRPGGADKSAGLRETSRESGLPFRRPGIGDVFFFLSFYFIYLLWRAFQKEKKKKSNVSESATGRQQLIDVVAWTGGMCVTLKTTTGINEAAAAKGHRGIRRSMKESALIGEKQNTNSPFFPARFMLGRCPSAALFTRAPARGQKGRKQKRVNVRLPSLCGRVARKD